jgi:hypothetical protein
VYLLIALLVVTGLYLQNRVASGWGWFLAGFYVYIVFVGFSVHPCIAGSGGRNRMTPGYGNGITQFIAKIAQSIAAGW